MAINYSLLAQAITRGITDALSTSGSDTDTARVEAIGAALRRGWDSASADKQPAPVYADPRRRLDVPLTTPPAGTASAIKLPQPRSGYATEIALRARIAELEAALAGVRVQAQLVRGECSSGDGRGYYLEPRSNGDIAVSVRSDLATVCAFIRRSDILAAAGLRGDL